MNRRRFLVGLGATAGSVSALVGSSAFSSVEAERSISVQTAQDSDAFLKMDALGEAERSSAGDMVEFEFPSLAEKELDNTNPQNPQGLGTDSVYRFESDVEGSDGLFTIQNQGTQPVDVYGIQENTDEVPEVTLFNVDTGTLLTENSPYEGLGTGEEITLGFEFDTSGVDIQENSYQLTLTIVAEAPGE